MNVVSLFSGAGGLDLGFIKAGHHILWANDIYEDAAETYKKNIGQHICSSLWSIMRRQPPFHTGNHTPRDPQEER